MTTPILKKKTDIKVEKPKQFKVIFLNDDFTPMDFVTTVLVQYFHKTTEEAQAITLEVHQTGRGIAGIYPLDTAETLADQTMAAARHFQHPLLVQVEPE